MIGGKKETLIGINLVAMLNNLELAGAGELRSHSGRHRMSFCSAACSSTDIQHQEPLSIPSLR